MTDDFFRNRLDQMIDLRHPLAVLANPCRVRGGVGLRVVDASSLPRVTSGNTAAPVYMLAERIADVLLGRLSL